MCTPCLSADAHPSELCERKAPAVGMSVQSQSSPQSEENTVSAVKSMAPDILEMLAAAVSPRLRVYEMCFALHVHG